MHLLCSKCRKQQTEIRSTGVHVDVAATDSDRRNSRSIRVAVASRMTELFCNNLEVMTMVTTGRQVDSS